MQTLKLRILASTLLLLATGAFAQDFELTEVQDYDIQVGVLEAVRSIGEPCSYVVRVWRVVQNGDDQPAFKGLCSDGNEYQITVMGQRVFVKPWTGTLLGY